MWGKLNTAQLMSGHELVDKFIMREHLAYTAGNTARFITRGRWFLLRDEKCLTNITKKRADLNIFS